MHIGKVVITSANAATAKLLIPRLREKGYDVTGLIRYPEPTAANETITDWTNARAAKYALGDADIIIHLAGDANAKNRKAYAAANYGTTKLVADGASTGKVRRIIYLSYANASTASHNLYLHYKGVAEGLLLNTGKEVVIFRCPVIIDAPGQVSRIDQLFIAQKGKPVTVIGDGRQKIRPVYRGDVVNAIVAAMEGGKPGIYDLSGPEEMTITDLIRLANRNSSIKRRYIPAWLAIFLSYFIPGLSPTFVDLMLHHTHSTYSLDTYREFGISPTSLTALWTAAVPGS